MFVVEVERRNANEEFNFCDIKFKNAIHEDCLNGRVEIKGWGWDKKNAEIKWYLDCHRCGQSTSFVLNRWGPLTVNVIKTAINGTITIDESCGVKFVRESGPLYKDC